MLSKRSLLAILFVLAFGLRAAFFLIHNAPLEFPDSVVYHKLAQSVCAGHGLVQDEHTAVFRPPLYPLFLASLYALFGPNLTVVGMVQALLGALTCLLVFQLARLLFDETTGLVAAGLTAVYPFFVFYSALALTETLFILLLALGMAFLLRAARSPSPSIAPAALAGLVFGLCSLTRTSFAAFLVFLAPVWWLAVRNLPARRAAVAYVVMFLCMTAALTPWAVRNKLRTGHLVFTSLQGGHDLYEANSPDATGGPASHRINWAAVVAAESPPGAVLTEYERDRILRNKALEYIRRNPDRFLRLAVIKLKRFWSLIPNYEKYRSPLYNVISLLSFGPVALLAIVAAVRLRGRWRDVLLLLSPLIYYTVLHTVFVGSTRYRTPVEPYLIVLAAYALTAPWAGTCSRSVPADMKPV